MKQEDIQKIIVSHDQPKEREHLTDGTPCWCNPKKVSYKRGILTTLPAGYDMNGKLKTYTDRDDDTNSGGTTYIKQLKDE